MIFTLLKAIISPISSRRAQNTPPVLAAGSSTFELKDSDMGYSSTSSITGSDIEAQRPNPESAQEGPPRNKPWSFMTRWKPSAKIIKDATIGLSDGMTVPFALMAGLTTLKSKHVVVLGGAAELVAGAISMAIGGWLGERAETKDYNAAVVETMKIIEERRALEMIISLFEPYGVTAAVANQIYAQLSSTPHGIRDYILKNRSGVSKPSTSAPWKSALTIGLGYAFGGLLPLIPYFFVGDDGVITALAISGGIMAVALFTFGYAKTAVVEGWTGKDNVKSALMEGLYMLVIGGAATGLAFVVTRAINHGF